MTREDLKQKFRGESGAPVKKTQKPAARNTPKPAAAKPKTTKSKSKPTPSASTIPAVEGEGDAQE